MKVSWTTSVSQYQVLKSTEIQVKHLLTKSVILKAMEPRGSTQKLIHIYFDMNMLKKCIVWLLTVVKENYLWYMKGMAAI